MKTIAVVNGKGGVGKTTIAVNLADALAAKNPVAIIDADSQGSARRWAELSATESLTVHPLEWPSDLRRLRNLRDQIGRRPRNTLVIVDCPPSLEDPATRAVGSVADLVLIPVLPSPLDLWAAEAAIALMQTAQRRRGGGLPKMALVPNQLRFTAISQELPAMLRELGQPLAPGISLRVALAESAMGGMTISEYFPGHPSDWEFKRLARYARKQLGL